MTLDIVSLLLGLLAGLVAGMGISFLLTRGQKNAFAVAAREALHSNNEQFLTLAQEKLKAAQAEGGYDLDKRHKALTDLIDPIKKNLTDLGSAVEQIKGTDKTLREDIQALHRETARLTGALRDPAGQGKWGEFILEGILEKSGLIRGVHFETQVSVQTETGRQRPDAVIHLHDGLHIIIDAKAPLTDIEARLRVDLTQEESQALALAMAKQIREHVRALSRKGYWENIESPDFTVLFLPSENLFSMALRADPTLVDFAADNKVIISSPTLIMALLRVVDLGWRQADLAKNAQDIAERGSELYQRLVKFGEHFEKIGGGIETAMNSYNNALGSLERMVLPAARKLKELNVQTGGKDLPAPEQIDVAPKTLTAPDFTDTEKKRA